MNPFAERFTQTLRHELLDNFVVHGEKHLLHVIKDFLEHYNQERPHQGVGNRPLSETEKEREPPKLPFSSGKIVCKERLGGLLKHYHCEARLKLV